MATPREERLTNRSIYSLAVGLSIGFKANLKLFNYLCIVINFKLLLSIETTHIALTLCEKRPRSFRRSSIDPDQAKGRFAECTKDSRRTDGHGTIQIITAENRGFHFIWAMTAVFASTQSEKCMILGG